MGRKSLSSLTYLACHPSAQAHSGYSEVKQERDQCFVSFLFQSTETFSLPALEQWIRSKLVVNPFSSQAMRGGASDRRCSCYRSNDVIGRLLVNSRTAPLGFVTRNKYLTMYSLVTLQEPDHFTSSDQQADLG